MAVEYHDTSYTDSAAHTLKRYHSTWRYVLRYIIQLLILNPALHMVLRLKVTNCSLLLAGRKGQKSTISGPDEGNSKPIIIMPNHQSHFDAPLIIATLPRKFGAKVAVGAATDNFFRSWLRSKPARCLVNTYPIDRDNSHRHNGVSRRLVHEGVPILVFPEGTRTRDGKLGRFHEGLAHIAIEEGAQILPVVIQGAREAWPADHKLWRSGRPHISVTYLPLITTKPNETAAILTKRVKAAISKQLMLK